MVVVVVGVAVALATALLTFAVLRLQSTRSQPTDAAMHIAFAPGSCPVFAGLLHSHALLITPHTPSVHALTSTITPHTQSVHAQMIWVVECRRSERPVEHNQRKNY